MKKKLYLFIIATMCLFSLTACGKKKQQTLSDNFAEMTTEIQGMEELTAQLDEAKKNSESSQLEESGNTALDLENAMSGDTSNVSNVVGESTSENAVSDNGLGDEVGDNDSNTITVEDYLATVAINNTLSVSNMCGKDLKEVYVTLNAANINNVEITGGKKLKDGNKVNYVIADMDSLKNASNIILTINAVNKKGETISFGDIRVVDPTNMNIVLTIADTESGYSMYMY